MRRRDFLSLIGGAAVAWPLAARAQQAAKVPIIGLLAAGNNTVDDRRIKAFLQRLQQVGWINGHTAKIEIRFSDGRRESAEKIAAEFAQARIDVIVTAGAVAILAAKQAMPTTPIVFAITADPVGTGLVDSLAHPGGMITGLSSQGPDYGGKQIDLLREIVPSLQRWQLRCAFRNARLRGCNEGARFGARALRNSRAHGHRARFRNDEGKARRARRGARSVHPAQQAAVNRAGTRRKDTSDLRYP
jgi:ABC-type uncharacterized transport system substrate-binding protein